MQLFHATFSLGLTSAGGCAACPSSGSGAACNEAEICHFEKDITHVLLLMIFFGKVINNLSNNNSTTPLENRLMLTLLTNCSATCLQQKAEIFYKCNMYNNCNITTRTYAHLKPHPWTKSSRVAVLKSLSCFCRRVSEGLGTIVKWMTTPFC